LILFVEDATHAIPQGVNARLNNLLIAPA